MESFGDPLEALQRPRSNGNEPFVAPTRVGRPTATRRYSKAGVDLRGELCSAGISSRRVNRPFLPGFEPSRDLVGVELSLAHLFLREIPNGKVFVPDHETNLPLTSFTPHATTEGP